MLRCGEGKSFSRFINMTAKKTAEGLIIRAEGDMEAVLLSGIMELAGAMDGLGNAVKGRMADGGGGTFYVLSGELEKFGEAVESLDKRLGSLALAGVADGYGMRTLASQISEACRSAGSEGA